MQIKTRITLFLIASLGLFLIIACSHQKSDLFPHEQTIVERFQKSVDDNLRSSHLDSAQSIALEVIKIEEIIEDYSIIFQAYSQVGIIHEYRKEYDSAMICYEKSYKIAKENKNQKLIAKSLHLTGNIHFHQKKLEKAKEVSYEAMKINLQRNDTINLAFNHSLLGQIHQSNANFDSALVHFHYAAEIFDAIKDFNNYTVVLSSMADVYAETDVYEKSLNKLKEVNAINDSINDLYSLIFSYNRTGLAFLNLNKYDSAVTFFKHSYLLADKLEIGFSKLIAKFNTGRAHSMAGNYDSANVILQQVYDFCIENKIVDGQQRCLLRMGQNDLERNFSNAANIKLTEGLILAKKNNHSVLEREFLRELTRLHISSNSIKTNPHYFERYLNVSDSLNKNEQKKKIAELEIRYETKKKDQDIRNLKNKNTLIKIRQIFLSIISVLLLTTVALVFFYFRNRNQLLRNKNTLVSENLKLHEIELEKTRLDLLLKNQIIENQNLKIRQKDQELVNSTLNKSYYTKLFEEFADKMKPYYLKLKNKKDQNEFFQIIENSKKQNSIKPIESFEEVFKDLHPNFMKSIKEKYPEISNRELQICAMIRLDMSSKEIASVTFLSATSIDNARYRIRKKMDLSTDINLTKELVKY